MKTFQKSGFAIALMALVSFASQAQAVTLSYTTNLALWLKPDALTTAGALTTWADDATGVGGTNDATATGTQKPTVVLNSLNGYSTVSFDGSDDGMLGPAFNFGGGGGNVFVVVNVNSTSVANGGIVSFNNGAGAADHVATNSLYLAVGDTGGFAKGADARWSGDGNGFISGITQTLNTWHIYGLEADTAKAADLRLFSDGSVIGSKTTLTTTANIAPTQFSLGARLTATNAFNQRGKIQIAEVLVYNAPVSDANRLIVEQYLYNKFFVPAPEPSSLLLSGFALIGLIRFARAKRTHRMAN
jgi:hypothetical protein